MLIFICPKMFLCPVCELFLTTFSDLKHHVCQVHDVSILKSITCKQGNPPCQRTYSSLKSLYRHINQVHSRIKSNSNEKNEIEDLPDNKSSATPHLSYTTGVDCTHKPVQYDFDMNEITFIHSLYSEPNSNRGNIERICSAVNTLVQCKFGLKDELFKNLDTEFKVTQARRKLDLYLHPKSVNINYSIYFIKIR